MRPLLLVPPDPLRPRRPDPHFQAEAEAARAAGLELAVWDEGCALPAVAGARVLWRGWMLRSERYAALAADIGVRGGEMIVTPLAYQTAHELPGWREAFAAHSASSWPLAADLADLADAYAALGPELIVKDHVKSEKQAWATACHVAAGADPRPVITRFLELRGTDLVGGVVLRRFERYGPEARSWWVNGRLALVSAHPDSPGPTPELPAGLATTLAPAVTALDSPFVTVDLAERDDGVWRVVEVGDGQVSDRPRQTPAADLVERLLPLWSSRPG